MGKELKRKDTYNEFTTWYRKLYPLQKEFILAFVVIENSKTDHYVHDLCVSEKTNVPIKLNNIEFELLEFLSRYAENGVVTYRLRIKRIGRCQD